ncbi:hypothetical protein NBRC116594_09300 [Shimia sp. NS0008-38b]|uniref:ATP-binding protein n=1 Tax=Shimia sp. NS0008-38b TaxID=3127653 RepID=UPI00310C6AEB
MTQAETRMDWMRQAVLLAAQCLVRLPPDQPVQTRAPHAQDHTVWKSLSMTRPAGTLAEWLLASIMAAERHPDAAAAFSILAEDERLILPTPASFAQIAAAGLEASFDDALQVALGDSPLHAAGLIETIDPAGSARPLTQQGMRLHGGHASVMFGAKIPTHPLDLEPCPNAILSPRAALAASRLMCQSGAVWIRATSRRLARQFALDVAGTLSCDAAFLRARDTDAPDLPTHDALNVIDLFDVSSVPAMPPRGGAGFAVIAPMRLEHPGFAAVDAPALDSRDLATLWATLYLPEADRSALALRFHLTVSELRAAQREAEVLMSIRQPANGVPTPPPDATVIAAAILKDGARRMGPSVTKVESDVTLDDLVCTPSMRAQLDDAVNWHRHGQRVWSQMGLSRDSADARGLSLLFSGPPGGGKTFAARCLANELELNLYRIDLSQVVSKYIGETEKALSRVFDEAEAGHGILFFDEADAIFGKRSEVKDAHDRYANIEVGFLLQRMETFDGVMILATNLRSNLDPAFLRRIRFVVDFPMPSRAERRTLWDRNLPSKDWRATGLDLEDLADRFRLSGGNIRNAAVAAAHLAAAQNSVLGHDHLARALVRELEKSGLPRGAKDLGPFADHLEGPA